MCSEKSSVYGRIRDWILFSVKLALCEYNLYWYYVNFCFRMMSNGDQEDNTVHSDEFNYLIDYGISKMVAGELEKIYATGIKSLHLHSFNL